MLVFLAEPTPIQTSKVALVLFSRERTWWESAKIFSEPMRQIYFFKLSIEKDKPPGNFVLLKSKDKQFNKKYSRFLYETYNVFVTSQDQPSNCLPKICRLADCKFFAACLPKKSKGIC